MTENTSVADIVEQHGIANIPKKDLERLLKDEKVGVRISYNDSPVLEVDGGQVDIARPRVRELSSFDANRVEIALKLSMVIPRDHAPSPEESNRSIVSTNTTEATTDDWGISNAETEEIPDE